MNKTIGIQIPLLLSIGIALLLFWVEPLTSGPRQIPRFALYQKNIPELQGPVRRIAEEEIRSYSKRFGEWSSGERHLQRRLSFNKKGHCTLLEYFDNNSLKYQIRYLYTRKQNMEMLYRKEKLAPDNRLLERADYSYDYRRKLQTIHRYNNRGQLLAKSLIEYNSNSISLIHFDGSGKAKGRETFRLDEAGGLEERKILNQNGELQYQLVLSNDRFSARVSYKGTNSQPDWSAVLNNMGAISELTISNKAAETGKTYHYRYKYDNYGNWTACFKYRQKTQFLSETLTPVRTFFRKIDYYEN